MTGMILDGVLMVLLVAALGYGVRLEKKLAALRAGQQAFASAVTELNSAAGRAEAALASLRASGQETDLLHDRIVKAREVKAQLESLIARAPVQAPAAPAPAAEPARGEPVRPELVRSRPAATQATSQPVAPAAAVSADEERARRMATLADRIQGLAGPARGAGGRDNVAAIVGALSANQSAKQSLNRARRTLDEDLFAA
jgi:hypothetical protein